MDYLESTASRAQKDVIHLGLEVILKGYIKNQITV